MTDQQFEDRVRALETEARRNPAAYQFRTALVAAAGYLYLFLMLVFLFGGLGFLIYGMVAEGQFNIVVLKLMIPIGAVLLIVARSLWVKIEEPTGLAITRADAPALFDEIEFIRRKLHVGRVHRVLVNSDFNASLTQVPRLGVLGWHKNFLRIGLPLMHALTPDQFRAVLAHEFGHLSGNHGRFGVWLYRVRQSWLNLAKNLFAESSRRSGLFSLVAGIFTGFFKWYVPRLNAYTFPSSRLHEFDADRCAADIAGAESMASALAALHVRGQHLSRNYWPGVYKQTEKLATPPPEVLAGMYSNVRSALPANQVAAEIRVGLDRSTDAFDSHPCLAERLEALGFPATESEAKLSERFRLAQPLESTAFSAYFGSGAQALTETLETEWRGKINDAWQSFRKSRLECRSRLQSLLDKEKSTPLTDEELLEKSSLLLRLEENDAAYEVLSAIVNSNPSLCPARLLFGQLLLVREDAAGLDHLNYAIEHDPNCVQGACTAAYNYLVGRGRRDEADTYRARFRAHGDELQLARQERVDFTANDEFEPHALTPEQVQQIVDTVAPEKIVAAAYLARKKVQHFTGSHYFLIGIVPHRPFRFARRQEEVEAVQRIAKWVKLPGAGRVVIMADNKKFLRRKVQSVPGALVYSRRAREQKQLAKAAGAS